MLRKQKTESKFYFKPKKRISYKPTKGLFHSYDYETQEKREDIAGLELYPVTPLYKLETEDENKIDVFSDYVEDIFADEYVVGYYIDGKYNYKGKYRYNSESKDLYCQETNNHLKMKLTLCLVAICEVDICEYEVAIVEISGRSKMWLEKKEKDGSNAETFESFNNDFAILLSAENDTVVVGSQQKKKKIHLPHCRKFSTEETTDEETPEIKKLMNETLEKIDLHFKMKNQRRLEAKNQDMEDCSVVFADEEEEELTPSERAPY